MDLLGWAVRGSVGGGCIPPVHTEGGGYQGVGLVPKQPHQLIQQQLATEIHPSIGYITTLVFALFIIYSLRFVCVCIGMIIKIKMMQTMIVTPPFILYLFISLVCLYDMMI